MSIHFWAYEEKVQSNKIALIATDMNRIYPKTWCFIILTHGRFPPRSPPTTIVIMYLSGIKTLILLSTVCCYLTEGLICLEDDAMGNIKEVSGNFTYCVFQTTSILDKGRRFGVGARNDETFLYDPHFEGKLPFLSVLSICVQEYYTWGVFQTIPNEMYFRCYCRTDRCNAEGTLLNFLADQAFRLDSVPRLH
uniref:Protein quiver n=1 Tax=Steinernema glaseri TaxID=37863 RepID=A0A1I8AN97_9BILA